MRAPWNRRAVAAGAALALDRFLGEPPLPGRLHPVALFGTAMTALERHVYDDRRAPGRCWRPSGSAWRVRRVPPSAHRWSAAT